MDAELVALGIGADGPVESGDVVVVESFSSEFFGVRDECLGIVRIEIEVETVLRRLLLRDLLEGKRRTTS